MKNRMQETFDRIATGLKVLFALLALAIAVCPRRPATRSIRIWQAVAQSDRGRGGNPGIEKTHGAWATGAFDGGIPGQFEASLKAQKEGRQGSSRG